MTSPFFEPLAQTAADQFTAMLARLALAILRPQMQSPCLMIGEYAHDGVDDLIRPRIDRRCTHFGGIWKRLRGEGEQTPFQLRRCRSTEPLDLPQRLRRRCALQFIDKECRAVGIGEKEMHAGAWRSRFGRLDRQILFEGRNHAECGRREVVGAET